MIFEEVGLPFTFRGILNWALYPPRAVLNWCKSKASIVLYVAKYAAKRAAICFGIFVVILWLASLLYASFYSVFVPSASLLRPAHFKFRVCPNGAGMCSFPMANVTLCSRSKAEVLGRGQQYRVLLELHVPDSNLNRDVGMFMVISRVYDRYGVITQESSRAVSLVYQSDLLKTIQTVVLSPLYITGFVVQTQTLTVGLFDEFWDDYYQPTAGVLLEIHSRHLSFYSAQLQFHAYYTGFRYYLFYYPLISAFCGITFNCMWLAVVFTVTWYHLGLELLEGPVVKVTSSGELAAERTDVSPTAGVGRDVRQRHHSHRSDLKAVDEEETDVETVPRSYIQPFVLTACTVPSDSGNDERRVQSHTVAPSLKPTQSIT